MAVEASSSVHPIHSRAAGLTGWVELPVSGEGPVVVGAGAGVAAVLSFPVDRLRSANPLESAELQRRIDARRFPTIDGVLTELRRADVAGAFEASGDITFRGVTRRCDGDLTLTLADGSLLATGSSTFDVRAFGMEPPRILMLRVHPLVRVRIDVVAMPAP